MIKFSTVHRRLIHSLKFLFGDLGFSFSVHPSSEELLTVDRVQQANTMLLAFLPLTLVAVSVGPGEVAISFFFVVVKLSVVRAAVLPNQLSCAVHLVGLPRSLICAPVCPLVVALALYFVVFELSIVR